MICNIAPTLQELDHFLNSLDVNLIVNELPELERADCRATLATFINEARVGFQLIEERLDFELRYLEVGSGLCLLTLFLKQAGYDIQALEPSCGGFGFFARTKSRILDMFSSTNLVVLDKPAQQLDPSKDGYFDVIFSNNVIEHIPGLDDAFFAMKSVLSERGIMVHGCPNYFVPYEPHFGIPVFSWFPALTKVIWRRKIAKNVEVWESLNFITYFYVKKLARRLDLSVEFEKDMMHRSLSRLNSDAEFRQRHMKTFVGRVFRWLEVTGTIRLTKKIPPWLSTPMIFTLEFPSSIIRQD